MDIGDINGTTNTHTRNNIKQIQHWPGWALNPDITDGEIKTSKTLDHGSHQTIGTDLKSQ